MAALESGLGVGRVLKGNPPGCTASGQGWPLYLQCPPVSDPMTSVMSVYARHASCGTGTGIPWEFESY